VSQTEQNTLAMAIICPLSSLNSSPCTHVSSSSFADSGEEGGNTWKQGIVSPNARKIGPQRPQMGPNYDQPEIGPVMAQSSTSNAMAIVPFNETADTEMADHRLVRVYLNLQLSH